MKRIIVLGIVTAHSSFGCGGKSSSGSSESPSTSQSTSIGQLNITDAVGFVMVGTEPSLRLAGSKSDYQLNKIKSDGTSEKVIYKTGEGATIADATAPDRILTPSADFLLLSYKDLNATFVVSTADGKAYKVADLYAVDSRIQPLFNSKVIWMVNGQGETTANSFTGTSIVKVDVSDPENPKATAVSASGDQVNTWYVDTSALSNLKGGIWVDKDGTLIYTNKNGEGTYEYRMRSVNGEYSTVPNAPVWLNREGNLRAHAVYTYPYTNVLVELLNPSNFVTNVRSFSSAPSKTCVKIIDGDITTLYELTAEGCTPDREDPAQYAATLVTGGTMDGVVDLLVGLGATASYEPSTYKLRYSGISKKEVQIFENGLDRDLWDATDNGDFISLFGHFSARKGELFIGATGTSIVRYDDVTQGLQISAIKSGPGIGEVDGQILVGSSLYGKCIGRLAAGTTTNSICSVNIETQESSNLTAVSDYFLSVKEYSSLSNTKVLFGGTNKQGKYATAVWDGNALTEAATFSAPIISIKQIK